jgi:hypothetical protein
MNPNKQRLVLTVALASAYVLSIPISLTVFPPRFGLIGYLIACGVPAALALAGAISLFWFRRHSPIVCALMPSWQGIWSCSYVFRIPESMPQWYTVRQLMFPLIWIAVILFVYVSLELTVANKSTEGDGLGSAP